jgi:hypothetical protein
MGIERLVLSIIGNVAGTRANEDAPTSSRSAFPFVVGTGVSAVFAQGHGQKVTHAVSVAAATQ